MRTTSTSRSARLIAAAAIGLTALTGLTGCAAGFDAQSGKPYQAAEGTNAQAGSLAVRNLTVMADHEGKGKLFGAIVNTGSSEDRLTKVDAAPDAEGIKVTGGSYDLKAGEALTLPPATGRAVTVTGAEPGAIVRLELTFEDAAPLTVAVPVISLDHYSPTPREDGEHSGGLRPRTCSRGHALSPGAPGSTGPSPASSAAA